jgi:hypothetical protein
VPESSGFYYPNRIARAFFMAMDEVMGSDNTRSVLKAADLGDYIDNYPPDDMERQFDFANLAAINNGLESRFGLRGGLGMAMSIGRVAFSSGLQTFGVMRGVRHPAFQALPLEKQLDLGLNGLASIFTNFSDQETEIEANEGEYFIHVHNSPFAWGQQHDRPVCHTLTGLLQEALNYTTNGQPTFVRETQCTAMGADMCVFRVKVMGDNEK